MFLCKCFKSLPLHNLYKNRYRFCKNVKIKQILLVTGLKKMEDTIESKIAKKFKLDEKTWMKHANPWSVYTRTFALPFLVIAIWSRIWFGWWSLIFIVVAIIWIWINPLIFPEAKNTENWASKGVFGERVWLNRKNISIPTHHRIMPNILNAVQGIGVIFLIWGLRYLDIWSAVVGLIIVIKSKLWYIDRMVCIYEDMKEIPEYKKWQRTSVKKKVY